MNTRKEILEKAIEAVDRRPKSYGPPEQNFERIARRWAVHYKNRYALDIPCDTVDVASMMIDMKLSRLEETPDHEDSIVDIAGYAACLGDVVKGSIEESGK